MPELGELGELEVLQTVRLKGRIDAAALVDTLRADAAAVTAALGVLARAGLLVTAGPIILTDAGRARCDELLAAERAAVDTDALAVAYDAFAGVNTEFKRLVTDWQLTRDDAALTGLEGMHRRIMVIVAAVATQLPRLAGYGTRLEAALARVTAGDTGWLARPTVDSYHTVWFELHQELIQARGLTRRSDD